VTKDHSLITGVTKEGSLVTPVTKANQTRVFDKFSRILRGHSKKRAGEGD